jgi:hypothetical protein
MLAQKIALETDERGALTVANKFFVPTGRRHTHLHYWTSYWFYRAGWPNGKPADEVRTEVRTLIAIIIASLVATSTAFARKASHHHFKRAAPKHQSATKTDPGDIARHPDDVALDRKIGSICRGC